MNCGCPPSTSNKHLDNCFVSHLLKSLTTKVTEVSSRVTSLETSVASQVDQTTSLNTTVGQLSKTVSDQSIKTGSITNLVASLQANIRSQGDIISSQGVQILANQRQLETITSSPKLPPPELFT